MRNPLPLVSEVRPNVELSWRGTEDIPNKLLLPPPPSPPPPPPEELVGELIEGDRMLLAAAMTAAIAAG
ncbi:unnamed protein product [Dibothriocephalus latus]|uniref:Uncharacterized protein n=1 Tax=Dibothriocephalus latus TaxID=60516 RepID=A0A3P7LCM2_DIBLA|nr:unnamed protein product [Dibothriocephalus latus]